MSKQDNLTDFLTDVADAIREKKGSSEKINPQNFSEEIRSIKSGGEINVVGDTMTDITGSGISQINTWHIADGVKEINKEAFYKASYIKTVTLPDSLEKIGDKAFEYCVALTSIELPPNLTNIGLEAFYGSSSLTYLNVPRGISNIPAYAFGTCTKLSAVYFEERDGIPTLANVNAFGGTSCKIVVPDKLYGDWIKATNWSTYANRIIKASEYVEPTTE